MDDNRAAGIEALAPLLAAFDTVAGEGHVTRAAELLAVPQSSLSRRLKSIEKTLGLQLFQPAGRGVALTPAGRELFERTRPLLRALDDAVSGVRSNADPDNGLVRFGFPLTLGPVSIPSLLADFHARHPGIRLHLVQAHGEALADLVRDGRLDLAVMIPPPADLPSIVLGQQRIQLYCAPGHHLAGRDSVALADLAAEPFIANPPTYQLRQLLDSWCAEADFTPKVSFETTEFETLRAFVAHGMGVALLPEPETPHTDIRRVAVTGVRERSVGLATGNHRLGPAAARLHSFIATHAKDRIH